MEQEVRKLKMYRKIIGILLSICLLFGATGYLMTTTVSAADTATLTVTGGSVEVGSTITVSVKVSAPADIGIAAFTLTYDTSLLQCEGYSGTISEADYSITGKSKTYEYKFKALKEGTASIKASKVQILRLTPVDGKDDFDDTSVTDGKVTIKAPYVASTNAYLKSLSIEEGKISPSFAKDTYEYSVDIDGKYSSVSVSAKAEDSKASVSVSGNKKLKEGKNTVEITVTAEDGKTKKTYKITVKRGPAPTSTPTPSPTQSPSPTPSATPTPGLTVQVDDQELTLLDQITAELPEGFTAEDTDIEGYHVAVAGSENEATRLVQLSDGKLYAFETADDGTMKCYPYRILGALTRKYLSVEKPDTVEVPEGFEETEIEAFGETIPAYKTEADANMYLAYLRSPEGSDGWYLIDTKEQTIQRYSDEMYSAKHEEVPSEPSVTPEPTDTPDNDETPTPPISPSEAPSGNDTEVNPAPVRTSTTGGGFWKLIENLSQRERIGVAVIGVLFALCVLLLVLLLIAHNRNAKEHDAEEPEDDEFDEPADKKRGKKTDGADKSAGKGKGDKVKSGAAAGAAAVAAKDKKKDRPKKEYEATDDFEDDMGTTFDPRMLAGGEKAHKANVDKAMRAMKEAEVAEKKAKKAVREAKKSLEKVEDRKPSVNDDYDEEDYL